MASDAAMVGTSPASIGMLTEAIGTISANCGCVRRLSVDLGVTTWTRHLMPIAVDIVAAIAGLLLRIGESREAKN